MAAEDKPKVVIATQRGHYGGKPRYRGERFVISNAQEFSSRWMIDAKDAKNAEEARVLEAEYTANRGPKQRDVSDDQLLAEVAQSSGLSASLRAENLKLKDRVNELEKEIAALRDDPDPADPHPVDPATGERPDEGDAEGEAGPDDEGAADGDASGPSQDRPSRISRRARR